MFDAFWNAWIAPLPDVLSADWFGALRDILSLLVGGVGTYLAWLAIKMGREQDAVTAKQMEIMEGQSDVLAELKTLESRQARIAEAQHDLVVKQALRRARPEIHLGTAAKRGDGPVRYAVFVNNRGNRTATGLQYEICLLQHIRFEFDLSNCTQGDSLVIAPDQRRRPRRYHVLRGHLTVPVHPGRAVDIGSITTDADLNLFPLLWVAATEDGRFPNPQNYGFLRPLFGRRADNSGRKS